MKRQFHPLLVILALFLLGSWSPAWAIDEGDGHLPDSGQPMGLRGCSAPPAGSTPESQAQALIAAVNQFRQAAGLVPATYHPLLAAAALAHSQDMSQNDFFDHIGSDGSTPRERVLRAGYSATLVGENLAAGQPDAATVIYQWSQSIVHRTVLLLPELRDVVVGYVYDPHDQPNVDLGGGQKGGPFCFYWTLDAGYQTGSPLTHRTFLPMLVR